MTITNYTYTTDLSTGFDIEVLYNVFDAIAGDTEALATCFVWDETPQGHGHWADISDGLTDLTDDDIEYLKGYARFVCERLITDSSANDYADDLEAY